MRLPSLSHSLSSIIVQPHKLLYAAICNLMPGKIASQRDSRDTLFHIVVVVVIILADATSTTREEKEIGRAWEGRRDAVCASSLRFR